MEIEVYLYVSASRRQTGLNKNARSVEEDFADRVGKAISEQGRVSNYGVGDEDPSKFDLYTMAWREADSPWAKPPLNNPDETKVWLREKAEPIKKALETFQDVRVVLVTTSTVKEVIE